MRLIKFTRCLRLQIYNGLFEQKSEFLCFNAQTCVFVEAEGKGDGCVIRVGFGFHRDAEYRIALFFDERGESHVFAANGENHLVCELEIGEIRFCVCVESQNLVARHLEFANGAFEVVWAADAELFESPGRGAGDARRDAAHSLCGEEQNVNAQSEAAADASAKVARVFDVGCNSNELLFASVAGFEEFFANVHPVEELLLVHEGYNAVVRAGVAVENLGIDLLHMHVGALRELLEFVELRVAGLVHKEHSVDLQRILAQELFDFLDAADGDLRCCVGIAYGGNDPFGGGTAFRRKIAAFSAFVVEFVFAEIATFSGKVATLAVKAAFCFEAAWTVRKIIAVTAEVCLAPDSATTCRFVVRVFAVELVFVEVWARGASKVTLAIVAKTATAIVIIETHFLDSPWVNSY